MSGRDPRRRARSGSSREQDELPWNTDFALKANYTAAPPPLFAYDGFGILDML